MISTNPQHFLCATGGHLFLVWPTGRTQHVGVANALTIKQARVTFNVYALVRPREKPH